MTTEKKRLAIYVKASTAKLIMENFLEDNNSVTVCKDILQEIIDLTEKK